MNDDDIGAQLAEWGKVALIETTGRTSGRPARAAVGFVEDDDGSVLVAAGSPDADWALNLRSQPRCTATIGEKSDRYVASAIDGSERNAALSRLILKYGTPGERLGRGPVFRLAPVISARRG